MAADPSPREWLEALEDLASRQESRRESYLADQTARMKAVDGRTLEMVERTVASAEEDFSRSLEELQKSLQRECQSRREYWQNQLQQAETSLQGEVKALLSTLLEEVLPRD